MKKDNVAKVLGCPKQIKLGALKREEVDTEPTNATLRDDTDDDASDEATPGAASGRELAVPVMMRSPPPRTP